MQILQHPSLEVSRVRATRTFFNADSALLKWSPTAKGLLVIASTPAPSLPLLTPLPQTRSATALATRTTEARACTSSCSTESNGSSSSVGQRAPVCGLLAHRVAAPRR